MPELKQQFVEAFTAILLEADKDSPEGIPVTPIAIKLASKAQAMVDEAMDDYWDDSGCSF
jgi:hypothetical protein